MTTLPSKSLFPYLRSACSFSIRESAHMLQQEQQVLRLLRTKDTF